MKRNSNQSRPLSKTDVMSSIQCTKKLWLSRYRKDLEAPVDIATQMQFDEGNEVGELARKHFGEGDLVDCKYWEYQKAHDETQKLIKTGSKIIYEAAFLVGSPSDGLYARIDILSKDKSGWHLIEVKKSTQVKDYHYNDAAVQTHIVEKSGLKIKSISIMHINNQVVYPDIDDLFEIEDITAEVRELAGEIENHIEAAGKTVAIKAEPKMKIGPHCDDPFDCPYKDYCWQSVPEKSIFDLPGIRSTRAWELFESGKRSINDLSPTDFAGIVRRAIEVTHDGNLFADKKAIASILGKWKWPFYFFDFESIGPAIPRYHGTRPYMQVPFQFSCHVWSSPDSKALEHFEYLHTEPTDPRKGLIKAMLDGLGSDGSIVAYNQAFEIGVIKSLADYDKKNKKALLALVGRFVDPLPIFRAHVYHTEFNGSFSIKSVAPALIGEKLNYDNLEIGEGSAAQAVAESILRGKIAGADLDETVKNLREYCQQDTMAMVEIVRWLMAQTKYK